MKNPTSSPPSPAAHPAAEEVRRYQDGWRAGKPIEDPDKLKRWGFITAKPSEYLIFIRRGQLDPKRSGQGARVFKWPWESVAIVPTTLQQIEFQADQVTRERVGVSVTGIAVYRIAHPELAYRVVNFTYSERASEKLAQTLREMFIGAARRLIANLSLEECLTRRKEALAAYLMEEIAPVLAGKGAVEDTTDQGWGVVLDTIEIQDVHILSKQVFEHLQAPYRAEIATRAEVAELERQRQVAERRAETERRTAEATIATQREARVLRARAEAEAAETETQEARRAEQAKAAAAAEELSRKDVLSRKRAEVELGMAVRQAESAAAVEVKKGQLEQERELLRIKIAEERRRAAAAAEAAALRAEADLQEQRQAAEAQRLQQERQQRGFQLETELSLRRAQVRVELDLRRDEAGARQVEAEAEAAQQRRLAEIEAMLVQGRALRELITVGLPQVAAALKQSVGTLNYTQLGGGAADGPLGAVAGGLAQVLAVARGLGLDLSRLGAPAPASAPPEAPSASDAPPPERA